MFMRIIKACLRFFGILLLRGLLGIVVAYLWLFAVAYLFHIIMDVGMMSPPDILDHFYDTTVPREERYYGRAAEFYGFAWRIGSIGGWCFIAVGFIWGFLQGRLDPWRWLRKRRG